MSGKRRKLIIDAIKELGKANKYEVYSGKVSAVDEEATTCDVDIEESVTVFEVRLRAVVTDDTGVWVLPKVGSYVQIAQIEGGNQFVLISWSEVDKVFVKIGDKTLEVSTDGFVFNGGANDGLVKVNELVDQLNKIEDKVNSLISTFNSHIHTTTATVGASAVLGVIAPTLTTVAPPLTNTVKSNIENPTMAVTTVL